MAVDRAGGVPEELVPKSLQHGGIIHGSALGQDRTWRSCGCAIGGRATA